MDELPLPGWDTLDFGLGVTELTVCKAVEEFLHYRGYHQTLSALKGEVKARKYYAPQLTSPEACLAAFDEGNDEGFFSTWNRVVPGGLEQLHTLEVKLRVHFAIFQIRWNLRSNHHKDTVSKPNFDSLKVFLQTYPPRYRKQVDSGSLMYYALVHIELPHLHPDFSHLFETSWVQQLRKDSEDALLHFFSLNQDQRKPMIYSICTDPNKRSHCSERSEPVVRDVLQYMDQTIQSAQNWMDTDLSACTQTPIWLDRAKQRLEVFRRALTSRESRSGSRLMSRGSVLASRQSLYSRYGPRPTRSQGRVSTAGASIKGRARRQTPLPNDTLGPLPKTDFARIGDILLRETDNLQDLSPLFVSLLRHCSSVYEPIPQRRTFLYALCCFDIFNFELPSFSEEWVMRMLSLDAAVALIAVIACEEKGRTYLQKQVNTVVNSLMQHLGTKGNTELQAIVALQRLSLRIPFQHCMIKSGLIEWIIKELSAETENAFLSDITLEFGSALLMNLALKTLGKERMEEKNALEVLVPLVDHPNAQVRTQANGTIYSLLALPSSHDTAKRLGLENILRRVMKDEDDIHIKQVEYLLDILEKGPKPELEESEEEDCDDECFLEEEELSAWAIPEAPITTTDFLSRDKNFSNGPSSGEQQFQEFVTNSYLKPTKLPQKPYKPQPQQPQQPKAPLSSRGQEENPRRQKLQCQGQVNSLLKRKDKLAYRNSRLKSEVGENLRSRQQR